MELRRLDGLPVPVFLVLVEDEQEIHYLGFEGASEIERVAELPPFLDYRGVEFDRLPTILSTGIDVEASDAVIYVGDLEKALEYGGLPKAVLALDPEHLERTWREVPADAEPEDLALITQTYRTVLTSRDGTKLWCSRLHENDTRITTDYEAAYARWIPGDPMAALRGVLAFATRAFTEELTSAVNEARDQRPSGE